jgi:hypothetical protein
MDNEKYDICKILYELTYEELVELVLELKVDISALDDECEVAEYELRIEEEIPRTEQKTHKESDTG